jgi:hypothetical protein
LRLAKVWWCPYAHQTFQVGVALLSLVCELHLMLSAWRQVWVWHVCCCC